MSHATEKASSIINSLNHVVGKFPNLPFKKVDVQSCIIINTKIVIPQILYATFLFCFSFVGFFDDIVNRNVIFIAKETNNSEEKMQCKVLLIDTGRLNKPTKLGIPSVLHGKIIIPIQDTPCTKLIIMSLQSYPLYEKKKMAVADRRPMRNILSFA